MILGFLLTVAGAYFHDTGARSSEEALVNWSVADRTFRGARQGVQNGWDRLTDRT